MNKKKVNIKKVLYIVLLVVLSIIFVSSLTFGAIAAFTTLTEEIEVWFASNLKRNVSLLKDSVKWLIISSILLVLTLSFKDFKKKYID